MIRKTGPVSYLVCLVASQMIWRRHQDHVKRRYCQSEGSMSVRLGQTALDPVLQLRRLQEALQVPTCQDSKAIIQPVYVDLPIALYFKGGGNVVIDVHLRLLC